jgi:hypothetical protein
MFSKDLGAYMQILNNQSWIDDKRWHPGLGVGRGVKPVTVKTSGLPDVTEVTAYTRQQQTSGCCHRDSAAMPTVQM